MDTEISSGERVLDPKEFPTLNEAFWLSGNWKDIRAKIHRLFDSIEVLQREKAIPESMEATIIDEKKQLESSMRRRVRCLDEVRRRYLGLLQRVQEAGEVIGNNILLGKPANEDVINATSQSVFREPLPPSDSLDNLNGPRRRLFSREYASEASLDDTSPPSRVRSMLDSVASTMRGFGLEIYDDNDSINPVTGMTVTVAVVIAICVASQYFG